MVPELFLQETRPVAVTLATIVNWMATFLVGFVFPYILASTHTHTHALLYSHKYTLKVLPTGFPLPLWYRHFHLSLFHYLALPLPLSA